MKNLQFNYKNSLISASQIKNTAGRLRKYLLHLDQVVKDDSYKFDESSINLSFDVDLFKKVSKLAKEKKTKDLKYIFVVGIGGSNLGTMAIYEAIYGKVGGFPRKGLTEIIFIDTVSVRLLDDIKQLIENNIKKPEEVLVNVISKSGNNTEPISNFEIIYNLLSKKFKDISDRVVATTGFGSKLWDMAIDKKIAVLDIPKKVGGRYSVFSTVGLFPLMIGGFDVENLLKGAQVTRNNCLNKQVQNNPAMLSAIVTYLHNKDGVNIVNNFFFNPELESVGKWYRQLMGESIGKEFGADGSVVNSGITPIVSIGSTDLHSMAQLYLGGPRDKFTNFVYSKDEKHKVGLSKNLFFKDLVFGVKGKTFQDIMSAIYGGTVMAYKNKKLPFVEVDLPEVSEYYIGQYMQFKMIEIMYLAQLLDVNAFDQPNVEDYKKETRLLLK